MTEYPRKAAASHTLEGAELPELSSTFAGEVGDKLDRLTEFKTGQGIKLEYSEKIAPARGTSYGGLIRVLPGMEPSETGAKVNSGGIANINPLVPDSFGCQKAFARNAIEGRKDCVFALGIPLAPIVLRGVSFLPIPPWPNCFLEVQYGERLVRP